MGYNIALMLSSHVEKTNTAIIKLFQQMDAPKAVTEIEKYKSKLLAEVLF